MGTERKVIGVKIPGLRLHRFPKAELDLRRSGRLTLHASVGGGTYIVHQLRRRFRWSRIEAPKDDLVAFIAGWWPLRGERWWDGEYEPVETEVVPNLPRRTTYVYFAGAEDGPIKIGFAEDPEARLRILQTSYPYALRILGTIEGGQELERSYHRRFSKFRMRGEWFNRHPELLDAIRQITG